MRQRQANREAVEKTFSFLTKIYYESRSATQSSISDWQSYFNISKSTGSACKKLGLISYSRGKYKWLVEEPTQRMALEVLEALRLKADKSISIPLAGFEAIQATLTEISEKITNATENNNNGLHRIKTPQKHIEVNGHNLFSEVDKKQDDLIKIVSAISTGVYSGKSFGSNYEDDVNATSEIILYCANNLLTKIYNK